MLPAHTSTKKATKAEEVEPQEETVGPQPIFLKNGLPLFVYDTDKDIDLIAAQGWQVFYIVGVHQEMIEEEPLSAYGQKRIYPGPAQPTLYKVINNMVSRAILPVYDDDLGTSTTVDSEAWFLLPAIPYQLIDKMDIFFRRVDEKLKSEAIVMLTYDHRAKETANPGDGWGVIVPKQTNSAGHCDYTPTTALEQMADEDQEFINIVGTAHSHPGMSSFASHTDHMDQKHNDGIHITFGWARNGPTNYHIEMQTGEFNWMLSDAVAISKRPEPAIDPEIEEWTKHVEKEPLTGPKVLRSTRTLSGQDGTSKTPLEEWSALSVQGFDRFGIVWNTRAKSAQLPNNIPKPTEAVLFVTLLSEEENTCPICGDRILDLDLRKRACNSCHVFLLFGQEPMGTIRTIRAKSHEPEDDNLILRWNTAQTLGVPIRKINRYFNDKGEIETVVEKISGDEKKV